MKIFVSPKPVALAHICRGTISKLHTSHRKSMSNNAFDFNTELIPPHTEAFSKNFCLAGMLTLTRKRVESRKKGYKKPSPERNPIVIKKNGIPFCARGVHTPSRRRHEGIIGARCALSQTDLQAPLRFYRRSFLDFELYARLSWAVYVGSRRRRCSWRILPIVSIDVSTSTNQISRLRWSFTEESRLCTGRSSQ